MNKEKLWPRVFCHAQKRNINPMYKDIIPYEENGLEKNLIGRLCRLSFAYVTMKMKLRGY